MIEFSASDPFPLVKDRSYLEEQEHAAVVDEWLGLQVKDVEECLNKKGCRSRAKGALKGDQQLWIGLASKSLLTPYTEIRNLLAHINPQPGTTLVDLGTGYGRMGFVVGRHYPHVNFIGYEYVGERAKEGRRCLTHFHYENVKLEHADLSMPDFIPVEADYYFIYDFGSSKAIEKTLHDLRRIALNRRIVVVGRGRHSRDLIERRHPWLSGVGEAVHRGTHSIYQTVHS